MSERLSYNLGYVSSRLAVQSRSLGLPFTSWVNLIELGDFIGILLIQCTIVKNRLILHRGVHQSVGFLSNCSCFYC